MFKPGELFAGPIGPVEILCIMGAMANFVFIMLGLAVRGQAGATVIDLGQTPLGRVWQLGLAVLVALSLVVPLASLASEDVKLFFVVRLVPVSLFLISLALAHYFGVRFGRRELAENGLIQGGWRYAPWENLIDHRWIEGATQILELKFNTRTALLIVRAADKVRVETFLKRAILKSTVAASAGERGA